MSALAIVGTDEIILRALGTFAMRGLVYALVPGLLLWHLMMRRRDVGSGEALAMTMLVLVAEIAASAIARPPQEPAGPWNVRALIGLVLVPGAGVGAGWGLLAWLDKRKRK